MALRWLVIVGLVLVVGLGLVLISRLVRSRVRERRKAQYFAELSAKYQKPKPPLPSATQLPRDQEPNGRMVTVEELVTRIGREGLPVRLRWEETDHCEQGEDDWPTGVLPGLSDDFYVSE